MANVIQENYWNCFDLRHDPFSSSSPVSRDALYFYLSQDLEQKLDLAYHLSHYTNVLIGIIGETGIGKTAFKNKLIAQFQQEVNLTEIEAPRIRSPLMLINEIADSFGIEDLDLSSLANATEQFKKQLSSLPPLCIYVIDDADHLSEDSLALLIDIVASQTDADMRLHFILLGSPRLQERLKLLQTQSDEELMYCISLVPLNLSESSAYLRHRLLVAGAHGALPLQNHDIKKIARQAQGNPSQLNRYAERLLLNKAKHFSKAPSFTKISTAILLSLIATYGTYHYTSLVIASKEPLPVLLQQAEKTWLMNYAKASHQAESLALQNLSFTENFLQKDKAFWLAEIKKIEATDWKAQMTLAKTTLRTSEKAFAHELIQMDSAAEKKVRTAYSQIESFSRQTIQDAEQVNLRKEGATLLNAIEHFPSIKWEKIVASMKNQLETDTRAISHRIETIDWKNTKDEVKSKTIASTEKTLQAIENIPWENLADETQNKVIASAKNTQHFVENIPWKNMAETTKDKVITSAENTLHFVENIPWKNMAETTKNKVITSTENTLHFVENIPWKKIAFQAKADAEQAYQQTRMISQACLYTLLHTDWIDFSKALMQHVVFLAKESLVALQHHIALMKHEHTLAPQYSYQIKIPSYSPATHQAAQAFQASKQMREIIENVLAYHSQLPDVYYRLARHGEWIHEVSKSVDALNMPQGVAQILGEALTATTPTSAHTVLADNSDIPHRTLVFDAKPKTPPHPAATAERQAEQKKIEDDAIKIQYTPPMAWGNGDLWSWQDNPPEN